MAGREGRGLAAIVGVYGRLTNACGSLAAYVIQPRRRVRKFGNASIESEAVVGV